MENSNPEIPGFGLAQSRDFGIEKKQFMVGEPNVLGTLTQSAYFQPSFFQFHLEER